MSHFRGAMVFVPSSEKKGGRMSFLQAQQACFEGEEAEDRIARRLKEENDNRVDAILDAEAQRRKENQDEAEVPASRTVEQRMKALQRLRSMEWKRNQQDQVNIAREQVVRYEEVKSQRAAEEVFFEGTRQGKTKTRRKFRKEEVIHSLDEIVPKYSLQQERKQSDAVPKKLPQPPAPPPPPGNAWLQKKGSELFGSLGTVPNPSSVDEEDKALRLALAASMRSYYAEQKTAEMAITRSVSSGGKSAEEKNSKPPWKNVTVNYASENQTDYSVRENEVHSSSPSDKQDWEDCDKKYSPNFLPEKNNHLAKNNELYSSPPSDERDWEDSGKNFSRDVMPEKIDHWARKSKVYSSQSGEKDCKKRGEKFVCRYLPEKTKHVVRNSLNYSEAEPTVSKEKCTHEFEMSGRTPRCEMVDRDNSQLYAPFPHCEELQSTEGEWGEEEEFQESNVYSDRSKMQHVTSAIEPEYSEPIASQAVGYDTLQLAQTAEEYRESISVEASDNGKKNDVAHYQDLAPIVRTNSTHLTVNSDVELPFSKMSSGPVGTNSNYLPSTTDAVSHFSRALPVSLNNDEKPTENACQNLKESLVDPSCFMLFAPVRSGAIKSEEMETSDLPTEDSCLTGGRLLVNCVPTPETATEPNPVVTSPYQEQNSATLSELNYSLAALKLQAQTHHLASLPRQLQPYAFIPGTPASVSPELLSPEAYLALLGMYGPMWQQAHSQGMFPAGSMTLDPRVQAAQLGFYASAPTGAALMQETMPPQQYPTPGMFLHPAMYPQHRPRMQPPHSVADPRLFQNAVHQQTFSHLTPMRLPAGNSMPFMDPRLANPHIGTDQCATQNVPVTSATPQNMPSAFLCAPDVAITSSSSIKRAPPGIETLTHQHPGITYAQAQPFLNQPMGVNSVGEHGSFPFMMQQPHINPAPVPFQPPLEPEVGRGRGRLRH